MRGGARRRTAGTVRGSEAKVGGTRDIQRKSEHEVKRTLMVTLMMLEHVTRRSVAVEAVMLVSITLDNVTARVGTPTRLASSRMFGRHDAEPQNAGEVQTSASRH